LSEQEGHCFKSVLSVIWTLAEEFNVVCFIAGLEEADGGFDDGFD
jgi:hypothetical protein